MEIILDFVMELYMELMMLIVPEKQFGKGLTRFLKAFCAIVSFAIAMLIIIGVSILFDPEAPDEHSLGITLLSIGCALLAVHVLLFIFVMIKRKNK